MVKRILPVAAAIIIIIGAVFAIRLLTRQCPVTVQSGDRVVMGTFANITVVAENCGHGEKRIEAGFAELQRVDSVMSDYDPDSELSRLNKNGFSQAVKVSDELFDIISLAVDYSKQTEGAFDITVGPLVDLWHQAGETGKKPTPEQIDQAKAKVGYDKLELNPANKTVRFTVDGMRIDLGGIAKGYGIDQAVDAIKEQGALGGIVNVGGDIRCFGVVADNKEHWLAGLQNPSSDIGLLMTLKIDDMAIATSGDYRRFVTIDNEKFSHIIDPAVNRGSSNFSSVTVIAPTAIQADILATAVSVMGTEKGMALIEAAENTEAILIPHGQNQSDIKSTGAHNFILGR